jgi:hypothetical protein
MKNKTNDTGAKHKRGTMSNTKAVKKNRADRNSDTMKNKIAKKSTNMTNVNRPDRLERMLNYSNQLVRNAERRGQPLPVLTFVVDNDCCNAGPFVFPVLPRKGEIIEAKMIWSGAAYEDVNYRVGSVIHSAPHLGCGMPHVTLMLHLATDDELYAPWPVVIEKPKHLK